MPVGLLVAVSAAGPQKRDFSHAGTASTAVRRLRTRPNRMKPGFHLALTRWKARFTGFTAGQTRPRGTYVSRNCVRRPPACGLASLNLRADPEYGRIRAGQSQR